MSREIPRADISQEIAEWQGAVYGEEVRTANVQALTKLQEQQNDACDMFEEIADDFDERDTDWEQQLQTATQKATAAAGSATAAAGSAADSEAYAVGKRNGTDVPTTDPAWHNNSKYYAEQAEDSADAAGASESAAESAKTAAQAAQAAAEEAARRASEIVDIDIATTERAGIVKPDGTTISVKEDGTISSLTPGRNLLDNPWFAVNQRGVTGGTLVNILDTTQYYLDRWYMGGLGNSTSTYAVNTSGLAIAPLSGSRVGIRQKIENINSLNGKALTASILLSDGTIYSGSVVRENGTTQIFVEEPDVVRLRMLDANNEFDIDVFAEITIKAVKLELGYVSTLANDTAPDYATELLKCQRYFVRYKSVSIPQYVTLGFLNTYSNNSGHFTIPLPSAMRILPSVSFYNLFATNLAITESKAVTGLSVIGIANNIVKLNVVVSSGVTVGSLYFAQLSGDGYVDLSADL